MIQINIGFCNHIEYPEERVWTIFSNNTNTTTKDFMCLNKIDLLSYGMALHVFLGMMESYDPVPVDHAWQSIESFGN